MTHFKICPDSQSLAQENFIDFRAAPVGDYYLPENKIDMK